MADYNISPIVISTLASGSMGNAAASATLTQSISAPAVDSVLLAVVSYTMSAPDTPGIASIMGTSYTWAYQGTIGTTGQSSGALMDLWTVAVGNSASADTFTITAQSSLTFHAASWAIFQVTTVNPGAPVAPGSFVSNHSTAPGTSSPLATNPAAVTGDAIFSATIMGSAGNTATEDAAFSLAGSSAANVNTVTGATSYPFMCEFHNWYAAGDTTTVSPAFSSDRWGTFAIELVANTLLYGLPVGLYSLTSAPPGPTLNYTSVRGNTLILTGSVQSGVTQGELVSGGVSAITDSAGNTWNFSSTSKNSPPAVYNPGTPDTWVFVAWCIQAASIDWVSIADASGKSDVWSVSLSEWPPEVHRVETCAAAYIASGSDPGPVFDLPMHGELIIGSIVTCSGTQIDAPPSGSWQTLSGAYPLGVYMRPAMNGTCSFTWTAAAADWAYAVATFSTMSCTNRLLEGPVYHGFRVG